MNINLKNLVEQYPCSGILHIGASTLQELPLYQSLGIKNRVWVEADYDVIQSLKDKGINERIHCASIADYFGEAPVYSASNNGESTSLLKPKKHLHKYPEITFKTNSIIRVNTLQWLFKISINPNKLNYLVLDIQGMELRALKGLGEYKTHFDVIITEAYLEELYEGCGMLSEIDEFLTEYQRVEFGEEIGKGWGDAAYVRKDLMK